LTCGPWRPVYLDIFSARIKVLSTTHRLSESLDQAAIKAVATVDGSSVGETAAFELYYQTNTLVATQEATRSADGTFTAEITISKPELWYPRGYGSQPLYTVKATVSSSSPSSSGSHTTTTSSSKTLGLRRTELVQRPLKGGQPGTTFYFRINGVPVFSVGADWIPADSFLPRLTKDKYRDWVRFAANGNHNMIRIWGGGVFEDESFYDECDRLGVMIWHDFMLGCGSYPVTKDFLDKLQHETIFNIKLLLHHPSIVLWCGNNEDHMFADRYPSGYDADDMDPESWLKTRWPARIIYDKILPELCAEYCPDIPYHPGSPWGGRPSNDPTKGDIHCWSVWMKALEMYPYQHYPKIAGRFVSEFGIKSYPSYRTLLSVMTDPEERHPQSKTMDAHGKSASKTPWAPDFRNIALYMFENLRHSYSLSGYVYASQLVQAEAMSYAYVGWRRLWRGEGNEECAGILCWQLNDCWPCVSWSLGDYHVRPKLAYYTIKRASAPLAVGVAREEVEVKRKDNLTRVHVEKETRTQVWVSNFSIRDASLDLEVRAFDVATGKTLWESREAAVNLPANQSTDILDIPFPVEPIATTIISARLLEPSTGKVIARFADWPQPLRHLQLAKPDVGLDVQGDRVSISADKPVKALRLSLVGDGEEEDGVRWDDNCVDVMPGDTVVVDAPGLAATGSKVRALHLGIAEEE
jgi:beta-mannosidase